MPLITAQSELLLIDFQLKLMPAIHEGDAAVANAIRLGDAARRLGIRMLRTEQYPKGLGATVPQLAGYGEVVEKVSFGSCGTPAFNAKLSGLPAIVTGCETHVCVLQTVLGLLARGMDVFVVADAVGSRTPANSNAGLARMAKNGAEIVTTEMVLFEWLERSDNPAFKDISRSIR